MIKEVCFQPDFKLPKSVAYLFLVLPLFLILVWEIEAFVIAVSIELLYISLHPRTVRLKHHPITLNKEGIRYNVISKELGVEYLPWSTISEIDDYWLRKLLIRISLTPGPYFDKWKDKNMYRKALQPSYRINPQDYDVDQYEMLSIFRKFHAEYAGSQK